MRRIATSLMLIGLAAAPVLGQEQRSAEQLQKELDDAYVQLKNAQDRKNELAVKNQELEKKLSELNQQLDDQKQALETLQNRAFFLRQHYDAWQTFIDQNVSVRTLWQQFFSPEFYPQGMADLLGDANWPFLVRG